MVWLRMKIYTGIISKERLLTDVIEIQDYFHIGKFYRFREWSSTVQPVCESDEILIAKNRSSHCRRVSSGVYKDFLVSS